MDLTAFANDLATETIDASIAYLKELGAKPACIVLGGDLEDLPIGRRDDYKKLPIGICHNRGCDGLIRVLTDKEVKQWKIEL